MAASGASHSSNPHTHTHKSSASSSGASLSSTHVPCIVDIARLTPRRMLSNRPRDEWHHIVIGLPYMHYAVRRFFWHTQAMLTHQTGQPFYVMAGGHIDGYQVTYETTLQMSPRD